MTNQTQEALKMAIAYAQDVKRGSAIVPTYHDVIINACKEALESQAPAWQGLSDDQVNDIWDKNFLLGFRACARAIEQALKEKNT